MGGTQGKTDWFNNGQGAFTEDTTNGFTLDSVETRAIALGDLDGDGDLDAFVANKERKDLIYYGTGDGGFVRLDSEDDAGDASVSTVTTAEAVDCPRI